MSKKCILLLLDGLGDRAFDILDHQTPLQAAHTPTLDGLAARGASGLYHAGYQGQALPSENAHFAIFGYAPADFPGRGPLEALGAGIDLGPDDVAVLAHFASLENDGHQLLLRNSRPDADRHLARQLSEMAANFHFNGIDVGFVNTHQLYGLIVLKGVVSPHFTDTDPLQETMALIEPVPLAGFENDTATCDSVAALKAYLLEMYGELKAHPINQTRRKQGVDTIDGLVTQRAGRLKPMVPFDQHCGLRGLSLASGLVYHGLSRYVGMDCIKVTDTTNPGTDIAQRLEMAQASLADYDFIHVHTKVPDEAGHAKDPVAKKKAIEAIDTGLADGVPRLIKDPDVLLVVTADHATPSGGAMIHSGETVPLIFCGPGVRRDHVARYDEIAAAQGALGPVRGRELLLMILNALDRAKLQGLMDTPVNQPYWPGAYRAFKV